MSESCVRLGDASLPRDKREGEEEEEEEERKAIKRQFLPMKTDRATGREPEKMKRIIKFD